MNKKNFKKEALLLFARYPFEGAVKTRLAAGIGVRKARGLYSCFLKDTVAELKRLDADISVFFTPAPAGAKFRDFLGGDLACLPQTGTDLGERMKNAFRFIFKRGVTRAIVIGGDIPELTADRIREAFTGLARSPAVIGPALDGGYYLLGLRKEVFPGKIFDGISWSSPEVFSQTMGRFGEIGVAPVVLAPLSDIDDIKDLKRFYRKNKGGETAPATLRFIKGGLEL